MYGLQFHLNHLRQGATRLQHAHPNFSPAPHNAVANSGDSQDCLIVALVFWALWPLQLVVCSLCSDAGTAIAVLRHCQSCFNRVLQCSIF